MSDNSNFISTIYCIDVDKIPDDLVKEMVIEFFDIEGISFDEYVDAEHIQIYYEEDDDHSDVLEDFLDEHNLIDTEVRFVRYGD